MRCWLRSPSVAALLWLWSGATARADVFDFQVPNDDNAIDTRNELIHRTEQVHDLAARAGIVDADWYRISAKPYSSYEVIIDQTSADVTPIVLQRIASDGTTVLQTAQPISSIGATRTLRWDNTTSTAVSNQYIKVTSGSCTRECNPTAVYRIRAFDTTYTIPRYYNRFSARSNLVLQNPTASPVTYTAQFWNDGGAWLQTRVFTVPARSVDVWQLFSSPGTGVDQKTGSATITAPAGYGELFGKISQFELVSLGAVANQAWDHPMLPRP